MIREAGYPHLRIHDNLLAGAFPGRDGLLDAFRLCLEGERVLTSDLRQELAVRGLDLETLALSVHPISAEARV
jgi:hypothetical protein